MLRTCVQCCSDYTKPKSAWSRLTEFLGLLGGLYTTFLGIGWVAACVFGCLRVVQGAM